MKPNSVAKDFYDGFATKLLSDFYTGNARLESALKFACEHLAKNERRNVLDLGFGLGWSSYEFSRILPNAKVTGSDLSPRLVKLAATMFGSRTNLKYVCQDLTDEKWTEDHQNHYDSCVMLDVYEHIPREARAHFHEKLSSVLSENAILILSCPTPLHQEFLRNHKPHGLQPVDEDVTLDDLVQFAHEIGGTLTHLEHKSIWATNDYFHAIIMKKMTRIAPPPPKIPQTSHQEAESFLCSKKRPRWLGMMSFAKSEAPSHRCPVVF